jgi:hypothetical protein
VWWIPPAGLVVSVGTWLLGVGLAIAAGPHH